MLVKNKKEKKLYRTSKSLSSFKKSIIQFSAMAVCCNKAMQSIFFQTIETLKRKVFLI